MAIAFDNALSDADKGSVSSGTQSFTVTGSNPSLMVAVQHTTASNVTSVTYGGVSMTQVFANLVGETTTRVDIFLLIGPLTGANDIVVTLSATDNLRFSAISHTGVASGGNTGGSDSKQSLSWASASGNQTLTTTTIADNAWVTFFGRTKDPYNAGTNVTYRASISDVLFIGDGGPKTPAGSFSQTFNVTISPSDGVIAGVGLKPFTGGGATTPTPTLLTMNVG